MAFVQHGNLLLARINQCLPVHDDLHNRQALVLPILGLAVDSPGYPGEPGAKAIVAVCGQKLYNLSSRTNGRL